MYFIVNLQRPWYIHYLLWLCVVCQFLQFNILLAAVTSWWTTHSKFFHIHSKESVTTSQVKICPKVLDKILLHPPKSQTPNHKWKSVPNSGQNSSTSTQKSRSPHHEEKSVPQFWTQVNSNTIYNLREAFFSGVLLQHLQECLATKYKVE